MLKACMSIAMVLLLVTSSLAGPAPAEQQIEITFTPAQLAALCTTPVTMVPAPGAGKAIQPVEWSWFVSGGTDWTDASANTIFVAGYAPTLTTDFYMEDSFIVDAGLTSGIAPRIFNYRLPLGNTGLQTSTAWLAQFMPYNIGGCGITGGTRKLTVRFIYRVVTVPS